MLCCVGMVLFLCVLCICVVVLVCDIACPIVFFVVVIVVDFMRLFVVLGCGTITNCFTSMGSPHLGDIIIQSSLNTPW